MAQVRHRSGKLIATDRSIWQDARSAMGNQLINAIIELATNCDDSYDRLKARGTNDIRIEVNRAAKTVVVTDEAEGMSADRLEAVLSTLGGETSGFHEDLSGRGLFGRGAKDVPYFGETRWISTRDGERNQFTIRLNNQPDDGWDLEHLGDAPGDEAGTTVMIQLHPEVKIRRHKTLLQQLGRHYAMRPMLLDPHRAVWLSDGRTGERIVYPRPSHAKRIVEETVEVPGFTGLTASIKIDEHPDSLNDGLQQPYWLHSLIVTSGRAAYEIWAGKPFQHQPELQHFERLSGRVDIPGLNKLILESERDPSQPLIITRDRKGLARGGDRSFSSALDQMIETALAPHIERMVKAAAKSTPGATSLEMRRRLDELGAELDKHLQEETDEELSDGKRRRRSVDAGLRFIPRRRIARPGEDSSVTVTFRPQEMDDEGEYVAEVHQSVAGTSASPLTVPLVRRTDYYSRSISLGGRPEGTLMELDGRLGTERADGEIEWLDRPGPVVTQLEFDRQTYTFRAGRRRIARLRAPFSTLDGDLDQKPEVSLQAVGATLVGTSEGFAESDDGQFAVFEIAMQGEENGTTGTLTASIGGEQAEAAIRVHAGGLAGLRVELTDEFDSSMARAWFNAESNTLFVNAAHDDLAGYLGPKRQQWPGQESLPFRTMLRELVCHAMATYTVSSNETGESDPAAIFGEYERQVGKLLSRTRAILVPDAAP